MESSAVWTHPLLYVDVEPVTQFCETATHCEQLAGDALETEDNQTRQELLLRLNVCLSALLPTLNDPIPEAQVEQFCTRTMPVSPPTLETESDLLCEYCLTLCKLLSGETMNIQLEETLRGLLYELTCYLADTIHAPRWLHTSAGLQPLP